MIPDHETKKVRFERVQSPTLQGLALIQRQKVEEEILRVSLWCYCQL